MCVESLKASTLKVFEELNRAKKYVESQATYIGIFSDRALVSPAIFTVSLNNKLIIEMDIPKTNIHSTAVHSLSENIQVAIDSYISNQQDTSGIRRR
ncbi:MAG: hypothetical protein ACK4PR_09655 [Gammaproteobacteria bacterium]